MQDVVLSAAKDEFFARNYLSNFGDLGSSVKSMLNEYQKHSKKNENISSIEDMQNFLERYPNFRAKSINITKHVSYQ
jgi:vacuolar protein sorting-associated protein 45